MAINDDMDLHGQALLDYWDGDRGASYILRRDDGIAYPPIPASQFFYPEGFDEIDELAVARCTGHVLDLGAGAGSHSLALQDRGLRVTSVDASPKAVEVMTRRGVQDARRGGIFDVYPERFETVLVVLNIGIVGDLNGLDRFLGHLGRLLSDGGRLITDSTDPRNPKDDNYRQYQEGKVERGRYFGERTLRFEYKGRTSDWFEWMHIDPETLRHHVVDAGYTLETVGTDGARFLVSICKAGRL